MATIGRPTRFRPEMCGQAYNCCRLGSTNDDLAGFFGVCPRTIDNWIAGNAAFAAAVRRGRAVADARVARCLYERAVGFDRTVERPVVVAGRLTSVARTVHYPPNVQACIFWLRHRRRETWGGRAALA